MAGNAILASLSPTKWNMCDVTPLLKTGAQWLKEGGNREREKYHNVEIEHE